MWKESHKLILGSGGIETGGMCLSVVEVIVTDDDSLSIQEQNIWKNSALYQRSATLSGYVTGARAESFISNKATHLHSIDNWGTQVHWVIFHFSEQTIKDQFKYIAYHFLEQTQSVNTKQTNVRTPTKCSASSTVWKMGNKGLDIWNYTTVQEFRQSERKKNYIQGTLSH